MFSLMCILFYLKNKKQIKKTLEIPVAIIFIVFIFILELARSSMPHGFFLVAEGRICPVVAVQRLPTAVASLWTWALERVSVSTGHMGLVAPQHMEASWTRKRTCASCTGRWILYH